MATNLALDDTLIEEARQLGGQRTKKEAVTQALLEYIQRRKQLQVLELFGQVDFDEGFDYKAQRGVGGAALIPERPVDDLELHRSVRGDRVTWGRGRLRRFGNGAPRGACDARDRLARAVVVRRDAGLEGDPAPRARPREAQLHPFHGRQRRRFGWLGAVTALAFTVSPTSPLGPILVVSTTAENEATTTFF